MEEKIMVKKVEGIKFPPIEVVSKEAITLIQEYISRGIIEEKYKMECIR